MNSQKFTDDADIGRALVRYVVTPSGKRPCFEITTPQEVFHFVTVEDAGLILSATERGEVTFVSFFGKSHLGKLQAFMWPTAELPALVITGLRICDG